ncbi:NADP-dependent oxidoreductase [Shewanella youngdeokensis]|uniref:NADP-dependent oxidoreductase n=1 Tax=Shewanella youngdeokensis TaxID=2999068 RepID=A0ABZ0JXT6_9GAMM|nr:NADP-dependent oxidoreductase [Shewanella sp. DAU334]
MKAIMTEQAGGIENLIMQEIAKPELNADEVLVETRAISINPADTKVKYDEAVLTQLFGPERPITLGWDIAGVVVATGAEVTRFKQGDKVFGMVNFPGHGKAYAEYVASPQSHLAAMPEGLDYTNAAATTLAALTALQALKDRVNPGDKVLIHAGSGGVGHFAIQIAKKLGAYVISTSSAKNRDFVMALGADEHIDYRTQAFEQVLTEIDLAFDTVSPEIAEKSLKVLRKGGQLVSIAMMAVPEELQLQADKLGVNVSAILVHSNGDDMNTLRDMLLEGTIKPHVSKTFEFAKLGKAHTAVESGRTVGKVVVTL